MTNPKDLTDNELFAQLAAWSNSLPQHQEGYVYDEADFTIEKINERMHAVIPTMNQLFE